jgi:hypothetical protein
MTRHNPFAGIGHTRTERSKRTPMRGAQQYGDGDTSQSDTQSHQAMANTAESVLPSLRMLFQNSPVITVLAQIQDCTLAWAGRISCTLLLSTGHCIMVHVSRDKLPPEMGVGDWIRAKLLLGRGADSDHTLLQATQVAMVDGDPTTSWLPVAAYLRNGHMHQLRTLLSQMEPAMQAIFMGVMSSMRVQQGFFSRVAAADHHGYPGGMFDHSVQAALTARSQTHLSARERGIAALVCLLFDLGKVSDAWLRPDRERLGHGLQPHPMSMALVSKALALVECMDADLVLQVRFLMQGICLPQQDGCAGTSLALQQCVYQSMVRAWQLNTLCGSNSGSQEGGSV